MDPIAHTLFGATVAQTRLRNLTPLATATLVVGANLPDIDVVVSVLGSDASLLHRRGWTHGVLAMVVLPWVLTGVVLLYDRLWRRRRRPEKAPVNARGLLILSYIGVLSHPFLDWLNTYGVRLLMPFDGRWFYGDVLFIIDAWMWLLMGAAVVFAYSQRWFARTAWILLGLMTTALITWTDLVPLGAKILWVVGVAVIVVGAARGVSPGRNQRGAALCLVVFFTYLALMFAGNSRAQSEVEQWLMSQGHARGETVAVVMTGPVPANPFARQVVARDETHYYGVEVRWFRRDSPYQLLYDPVPIVEPDEVVQEALRHPGLRGFTNWMRFPVYEVREVPQGTEVLIRDLRYVRPDEEPGRGIGIGRVLLE